MAAKFQARGVPPRIVRQPYHKPTVAESPSPIRDIVVAVACPNCGASGDDPCLTPSGKVKDTWHAKREA